MKIAIHRERIDITELPKNNKIDWTPILDDLKVEPLPGLYEHGQRMGVSTANAQTHVHIYRTDKTPPESEIWAILKMHGIAET